jgi:UDP-2,3-diacylglucosamine hydrolase
VQITAPPQWQCIDFISDVHLQPSESLTFETWRSYLCNTQADAVFILGDLFEVWVGDDALNDTAGFEQLCAQTLAAAGGRLALHIMHGNRDFLMGSALMSACNATLLSDPCVLDFAGHCWLLSHGDSWCLGDTEYMQFRKRVRSAAWQGAFLDQPLATRTEAARLIREQSEARKRIHPGVYADVDTETSVRFMESLGAQHLIHGHTHRPARHPLVGQSERLVLSDWDMRAIPARAEVLRLRRSVDTASTSFTLERIPPGMAAPQRVALTPTPAG